MTRVRGTDAFALQIMADNAHVEMTADLLGGAQTGRSDRLVFTRKTQCGADIGTFKGSLKVILRPTLVPRYLRQLPKISADLTVDGAHATFAAGKARILFPCTAQERKRWVKARSGNLYLVVHLWLGISTTGTVTPVPEVGDAALLTASLIYETQPAASARE